MKPKIIFGPAGRPLEYKKPAYTACDYIAKEGLMAYEYQAGRGLRISEKSSKILKKSSIENNVTVSIHAPYFINLSSNKESSIKNSIEILIKTAQVAEWMGAYRIVFHPGYYTHYKHTEALKIANIAIKDVLERLDQKGIADFIFAPETTGKRSQLGSLDEIIAICQKFDKFEPTIDFAHLHARGKGLIHGKEDYNKILSKLENELDIDRLHCHFTRIEYSNAGEVKHHTLNETDYGPDPKDFIESLVDNGFKSTIICESPFLDKDALIMKEIYDNLI
jgi:deoxyribonuclease-4